MHLLDMQHAAVAAMRIISLVVPGSSMILMLKRPEWLFLLALIVHTSQ